MAKDFDISYYTDQYNPDDQYYSGYSYNDVGVDYQAPSYMEPTTTYTSNDYYGGSGVSPSVKEIPDGEDSFFSSSGFYKSLLEGGIGLAGTYFKQAGDKEMAEQAALQRMKELEYMKANQKPGGGGGGGGAGAALQIAKMNNLSALYQNWAQLAQRSGENLSKTAIDTGQLMQNPIIARAGVLR